MKKQLHMVWHSVLLDKGANSSLPAEYKIRTFEKGDEDGHIAVMHAAGFLGWNEKQLKNWLHIALPNGIFVAVHKPTGEIVATAMASHRSTDLHPSAGELGWVAASPSHSGKGLGKAVCRAALSRALSAGYDSIYLLTDDHRLAAVKTYLKLGFVPFLFTPDMEKRWVQVLDQLDWPCNPESWFRAPEELWVDVPQPGRPDKDSLSRYVPRHKWIPDRNHRGFSCNGDVDAFGDESLYQPSRLGSASVEPREVTVGTVSPLNLTFVAGPAGVPEGASVTFVMRGQRALGAMKQPLTVAGPGSCELESAEYGPGFIIRKGVLGEGDTVQLTAEPFSWTPIAGRREFKVVIGYGDSKPEQRFPEPVVVHVRPDDVAELEVTLPCTHRPGSGIDARLTARDRYDNRAIYSGPLSLDAGENVEEVQLAEGITTCRVETTPESVTRVSVSRGPGNRAAVSNPSVPLDGRQLYVGDLHCHDFLSEAEGYPDQVYRWAIEDRMLDFVSVVPQSHGWHDNETWTLVKYMNERFLDEGKFVTLLGFEWQHSGYGDKVVHYLGGDQPYLPRDDMRYASPAGLYKALRNSDAIVISHHPAYPAGTWCSSTDFDAVEPDMERLVELWSMHGSSEGYDTSDRPLGKSDPERSVMSALRRGLRLGFTGGSDTHRGRPGGSIREPYPHWGGLTGIWADNLTRRALFAALLERRTYALTRARIVMKMTVNGNPMGSEVQQADEADIKIDAWAPSSIAGVEIIKNASLLDTFRPASEECHLELCDKTEGPAFYHCRVKLDDGNLAVCSPVWLG